MHLSYLISRQLQDTYMGTFTYDIRSGGRGFSPKADKNTDGVHDSDSDSQNFADITYVSHPIILAFEWYQDKSKSG